MRAKAKTKHPPSVVQRQRTCVVCLGRFSTASESDIACPAACAQRHALGERADGEALAAARGRVIAQWDAENADSCLFLGAKWKDALALLGAGRRAQRAFGSAAPAALQPPTEADDSGTDSRYAYGEDNASAVTRTRPAAYVRAWAMSVPA